MVVFKYIFKRIIKVTKKKWLFFNLLIKEKPQLSVIQQREYKKGEEKPEEGLMGNDKTFSESNGFLLVPF